MKPKLKLLSVLRTIWVLAALFCALAPQSHAATFAPVTTGVSSSSSTSTGTGTGIGTVVKTTLQLPDGTKLPITVGQLSPEFAATAPANLDNVDQTNPLTVLSALEYPAYKNSTQWLALYDATTHTQLVQWDTANGGTLLTPPATPPTNVVQQYYSFWVEFVQQGTTYRIYVGRTVVDGGNNDGSSTTLVKNGANWLRTFTLDNSAVDATVLSETYAQLVAGPTGTGTGTSTTTGTGTGSGTGTGTGTGVATSSSTATGVSTNTNTTTSIKLTN